MKSFELLSKVIQNFGTEGKEVQLVIEALSQSIKGLEIDTAQAASGSFDDMLSSWKKLKAAMTDGLDTQAYIQMLTEYQGILSETDFILDETTGKRKLSYEATIRLAEA